jgi:DNA-binding response OmpR family regulator
MKKKVIALADNSYTIRRIVELSFSEIENIEVHSFENGSGLKEKLLALEPDVVIVDIKLPEISGYDVCRFVNETPKLSRARVFLMKGSFEAVDNDVIKNLRYEDIVTKPFDSNALVGAVMKKLSQEEKKPAPDFPEDQPSSFPEDLIEIETEAPPAEGISFSDLRLDLNTQAPLGKVAPPPPVLERDEILPSEEITQGTQPLKDALQAPDAEETIQNPFNDEPIADDLKVPYSESIPVEAPKTVTGPARKGSLTDNLAIDISDEFHERFEKSGRESTSETVLISRQDKISMPDARDARFSFDPDAEIFPAKEGKGGAAQPANAAPAHPLFTEKDETFDFAANPPAAARENIAPGMPEKPFADRLFVQKVRPDVMSPEAELAKLSQTPAKEAKSDAAADAGFSAKEKTDLSAKLEEKLALTIKELIWEIVPSLAEKIIKEEIEKIKSETSNTGF